jgi:undecaprenyl-diphosphatase
MTDGNKTEFGSTAWKATDAAITGAIASKAIAYGIGRQRPENSDSPHKWFSYGGGDSFPSGHVTTVTAIVTPYILNYQERHPEVWALAALPLFEAIGRVKANKHWNSDTIAGIGLGAFSGYLANNRKIPLILQYLPNGEKIYIGYNLKF